MLNTVQLVVENILYMCICVRTDAIAGMLRIIALGKAGSGANAPARLQLNIHPSSHDSCWRRGQENNIPHEPFFIPCVEDSWQDTNNISYPLDLRSIQ